MRPYWRVFLALWMLATGLIAIASLSMNGLPQIMGVIAVLIGLLMLLDK